MRGIHSSLLALCEGNQMFTSGIPSQRPNDAENVSMSWRHHVLQSFFESHLDDSLLIGLFFSMIENENPNQISLVPSGLEGLIIFDDIQHITLLAPGNLDIFFKNVIFYLFFLVGILRCSYENVFRWMPWDITDDKPTLADWCLFVTSHSVWNQQICI